MATATTPIFVSVDATPEVDPYHRDTGTHTWSKIWIDLETGRYGISQEYDDHATPVDEYTGRTQATRLETRPAADRATAYLTGEGAALVQRVLDGADIDWDGHNRVGRLDDDAQAAWDEIVAALGDMEDDTVYWTAEEAYGNLDPGEIGITADTTDDEIAVLAANSDWDNNVIIDDVADYLRKRRDALRD